jgi:hypothetical protein
MALNQNRLTATINIRIRPEATLIVPIRFTAEDEITDYDLSSYDLYLSVWKGNIIALAPNGTGGNERFSIERKAGVNPVIDSKENGIQLLNEAGSLYAIIYDVPTGNTFDFGTYTMNLVCKNTNGYEEDLVTIKVEVTNDEVPELQATSQEDYVKIPLKNLAIQPYILPLKKLAILSL